MPVQRVVMPVTGVESWTVLGDDGGGVVPAAICAPVFVCRAVRTAAPNGH